MPAAVVDAVKVSQFRTSAIINEMPPDITGGIFLFGQTSIRYFFKLNYVKNPLPFQAEDALGIGKQLNQPLKAIHIET